MADLDVQDLRDATEEFSVVLRDMVSLQERVKLLQEEVAAQINEQTNRSLFVLTIVTVLALPINIIAGLLGMNVGGIPLAQSSHGFLVIVLVIATFTVLAGWLACRRAGRHAGRCDGWRAGRQGGGQAGWHGGRQTCAELTVLTRIMER